MAGEWIKMRWDLEGEPEVIAMAEMMGIDVDAVLGKIYRLWCWAEKHTADGHAAGVTQTWLEWEARAPGFAKALEKVGWLRIENDGLVIPDFRKHMGKVGKGKALATNRQARKRATEASRECHATNVTPVASRARASLSSSCTTYKSKKNTKKEFLPDTVPLPFSGEEFQKAWHKWCEHRREIKKPLTPTCCNQQLAWCEKVGKDRAVAALDHTMRQGWVGIREPEETEESPRKRRKPTADEIIGVRRKKNDD